MNTATLALALGGLGVYLATRFGTQALIGRRGFDSARAGTVAIAHWIPTCVISLIALLRGRPEIAVGVTFSTAVAALSLAIGMICFLTPGEATPPSRRVWPFIVPAALLVLLAGFGGSLRITHALMLGGFGIAVWLVWRAVARDSSADEADELVLAVESRAPGDEAPVTDLANPLAHGTAGTRTASFPMGRVLKGALALIAACIGAWFVIHGTLQGEGLSPVFRATLMASGVISPLLTLPLLAAGTDMAQRNRAGEACSACVAVGLLNLLALLPSLIVLWWIRQAWLGGAWPVAKVAMPEAKGWMDGVELFVNRLPTVPLPIMVWRVDTVVIALIGVMLLPAAMGTWRIRRLEAIFLVLCYASYLAVTAYMTARVGGV